MQQSIKSVLFVMWAGIAQALPSPQAPTVALPTSVLMSTDNGVNFEVFRNYKTADGVDVICPGHPINFRLSGFWKNPGGQPLANKNVIDSLTMEDSAFPGGSYLIHANNPDMKLGDINDSNGKFLSWTMVPADMTGTDTLAAFDDSAKMQLHYHITAKNLPGKGHWGGSFFFASGVQCAPGGAEIPFTGAPSA
jgi:hypothetical protein